MPSGQEPGLREERTEQGEGWQRPGGGLAEAGDITSLTQAENDLWPELCTKSKGGGGV